MAFVLTAQLRLAPFGARNVARVRRDLQRQLRGTTVSVDIKFSRDAHKRLRDLKNAAKNAAKITSGLGDDFDDANKRAKNFSHSVFLAAKRLAAYAVGALSARVASAKLSASIADSVRFETGLTKLSMIMGTSLDQSRLLGKSIRELSANYGAASENVLEATKTLASAGFTAKQITESISTLAAIDVSATFGSLEDASNAIIVLKNVFGQDTGKQFSESLSTINTLSKRFPAEAKGIVSSLQIMGSAFSNANASFDETISTFVALKAATRETDSTLATALKTISTRIQRAKSVSLLKAFGIDAVKDGKFRPIFEVLGELSKVVETYPRGDTRISNLLESLGGARQGPRLLALLRNWDMAQNALNEALRDSNSLQADAELNMQTLTGRFSKARTEFALFTDELVANHATRTTIFNVLNLAGAFSKLAKTLAPILPMLAGLSLLKFAGMTKLGQTNLGGSGGYVGWNPAGIKPSSGSAAALRNQTKLLNRSAMILRYVNTQYGSLAAKILSPLATRFPSALVKASNALAGFSRWLRANMRTMVGGGAMFGLLAAQQIGVGESAIGQAGMASAGVGAAGVMLGVNPFVTALSVATIALIKFGQALEEKRIADSATQLATQQKQLADVVGQTGNPTHRLAIKQYQKLFADLSAQYKEANSGNGIDRWSVYSRAITSFDSPQSAREIMTQEAWVKFRERANASSDSLVSLRDAIAEQVQTYDQFLAYGNGLGRELINVADIVDNGSIDMDSAFEQITKEIFANKKALAQTAKSMSLPTITISSQQVLADLPRQLTPSLENMFGGFATVGNQAFADSLERLNLTDAQRQLGYQVNRAFSVLPQILSRNVFSEESFKDAISQQLMDGGVNTAIVAGIENELEALSFDQFSSQLSNLDSLTAALLRNTDDTVSALKTLGDATLKVKQRLLDNLKTLFGQKTTVAEGQTKLDDLLNELRIARGGTAKFSSDTIVRREASAIGGSSNVGVLANNLFRFNEMLKRTGDLRFEQSIEMSKNALVKLADASSRVASIQAERIDAENKLSSTMSYVEAYATDNGDLARGISAARKANTAGLSSLSIEDRSAALSALNAGRDVDLLGTGQTGQQIRDKLLRQFAIANMKMDIGAQQKTIDELRKKEIQVIQDAFQAQRALVDFERKLYSDFLARLSAENRTFLAGLGVAIPRMPSTPLGGRVTTGGHTTTPTPHSGGTTTPINMMDMNAIATMNNLAQSIANMPRSIELNARHEVNVTMNGLTVLKQLEPGIRDLVVSETNKAITKFAKQHFPNIIRS